MDPVVDPKRRRKTDNTVVLLNSNKQEENHVDEERVDFEIMPSVELTNSQLVTQALKEGGLPFKETLFENVSCSREPFNFLNSSSYYYLYHDLFNGLIFPEATRCANQINSIGSTHFEGIDGGNVHMEDREDKDSSRELITIIPYQLFSWDEGNVVEDVYQIMSSYFSSSFFINRESSCSSIPLVEIVGVSSFHHCIEDISYTMVDASPCIVDIMVSAGGINIHV
jgi:hypothetical protein